MDIEAAVSEALEAVPADGVRTLVGLAGSVTTVTAQAWSLPYYDPRRIHLAVTPVSRMRAAAGSLLGMTRAHRAALPFMHPGRVDVIGAGALVWDVVIREVAERSGRGDQLTVVSSEHDILDGLAALARLSPQAQRRTDWLFRADPAGIRRFSRGSTSSRVVVPVVRAGSSVQPGFESGNDLRPQLAGLDHLVHRTDLDGAVDAVDRVELGRHLAQLLRAHR